MITYGLIIGFSMFAVLSIGIAFCVVQLLVDKFF